MPFLQRISVCIETDRLGLGVESAQKVIQTTSVRQLTKRLTRFLTKHGNAINTLLEMAQAQSTPKTTNALVRSNIIFKPISQIAKFFSKPINCQVMFAGVSLMENFDVKTRGINLGTSAMQRAKINFEELGGSDFFEVVGLPTPQISLPKITAP